MSRNGPERIPRPLLLSIGGLVLLTLAGVTAMRLAGVEPSAMPPAEALAEARTRVLLEEDPGGGVTVRDPATGAVVTRLEAGKDGFVRGMLRVLARTRMQHRADPAAPVELVRWPGGHLALLDPETGWRAELIGFGADNLEVFAQVMSDATDTGRASR